MSGQIQDGDWTVATQDGAKRVSLPLQDQGDYYATLTNRRYVQLATYFDPIIEQRTSYANLLTHSDDFSNAAWVKAATTATAASTDPEGNATASKLVEDNTNAAHNASQAITVASGALSFGVFIKAGERNFVRLRLNNGTDGNLAIAVFNVSTGVVLSGTGTIKRLFNGWFWCFVSGTATIANSTAFVDLSSDGTSFSYAGTTGSGAYLWHATTITTVPAVPWPAILTTASTRAISSPAVDPDDPISFLIRESDPSDAELEFGIARWTRDYARISTGTTNYSSRSITKPTIPNEATTTWSLASVIAQGVEIAKAIRNNTGFWTSDDRVFAPFSAQVVAVNRYGATAGTFTFTYKTSTTAALAYNASDATLAAAVNGLASIVSDGITVTVTSLIGGASPAAGFPRITIAATAGSFAQTISMDASGLTVSTGGGAAKLTFTRLTSSTGVLITFGRTITAPAHGLTNGVSLVAMTNQGVSIINGLVYTSSQWSVYDANTIAVMEDYTATSASFLYLASYLRNYTPGAVTLSSRITGAFFLPGVSPGITAVTDIPVVSPNISDADVISAALNTTGFQPVDFTGPSRWMNGAIWQTTETDINFNSL